MMANIYIKRVFVVIALIFFAACADVPREAVELSATVGRDLEEVHRSHRVLAQHYFDGMEEEIQGFIDNSYAPQLIARAAAEFQLDKKVKLVVENDPNKLLPLMTGFVDRAHRIIEQKRRDLLNPLKKQRNQVLESIDLAHKQLQAANAIVTAHLASVRKVYDAQNAILGKANLGGLREKVAMKTADLSDRVADLVTKGEKAKAALDKLQSQKGVAKVQIEQAKSKLDGIFSKIKNITK